MSEKVNVECGRCGCGRLASPSKRGVRAPRGWKRQAGDLVCESCWRSEFRLRAITLPVVGPVGREWDELRDALRACWSQSTALANWITRELYVRDVRRDEGLEKLPPRPRSYLYPETGAIAPLVASQVRAGMERSLAAKYDATRYHVLWSGERQLATYRYPYPYAVPSQAWSAAWIEDDRGENRQPTVSAPIAGARWTLRLRSGWQYRRQLAAFAQIVSGAAERSELALYRQRASDGDHRTGMTERDGAGQQFATRVMCKLVAWLPREHLDRRTRGVLRVRTDAGSLLYALDADGERIWAFHADHVRRWVREHAERLQRWSDDRKAEQRPQASFQGRLEASVAKQRRRMDSLVKEMASQVVGVAYRRRLAELHYDDAARCYVEPFPWHALRERIRIKCEDAGIEFVHASGAAPTA